MSKYTEAIEKPLVGIIQNGKGYVEADDEWLDTVESALEIADRLEQAHWTRSDGISDILYDLDCTAGVSHSDIFVQGYEKALADIRGDNND